MVFLKETSKFLLLCWVENGNSSQKKEGYSQNHIDIIVYDVNSICWRLTAFYGFPERSKRKQSWDLLRRLSTSSSLPWVCLGDFSDILSPDDKNGRVEHPAWLIRRFREVVSECGLTDLSLNGYSFTWERGRGIAAWVEERLDRALVNEELLEIFPNIRLTNLVTSVSDHSPIQLDTAISGLRLKKGRFRFENGWLREEDIHQIITGAWVGSASLDLVSRLEACCSYTGGWSKRISTRFKREIEKCKNTMESLRGKNDGHSVEFLRKNKKTLLELLKKEEDYWRQRENILAD